MTDGWWSEGIMGYGAVILYDGHMVPIHEVVKALNRREITGFSYVNVTTKDCEGWLNLFFDDYPIALVNNAHIANQLRERIPERVLTTKCPECDGFGTKMVQNCGVYMQRNCLECGGTGIGLGHGQPYRRGIES